jgi:uncharacterized protein (DUF1499 family)
MARALMLAGKLGSILALISAILVILSPIGYRLGWWGVPIALLQMIKWGMILAIAAFVLCLASLIFYPTSPAVPNSRVALLGLFVSVLFAAFPLYQFSKLRSLPYIHDISTDTELPPAFVALADVRKSAPNGAEYKGAAVADLQKKGYPNLAPFDSKLAAPELFAKAQQVARDMKLDIAGAEPNEGRIEATATSLFYGFKDDVVLRIKARDGGSRLDMRSMSRVGRSDVGANAARIDAFFAKLRASGA